MLPSERKALCLLAALCGKSLFAAGCVSAAEQAPSGVHCTENPRVGGTEPQPAIKHITGCTAQPWHPEKGIHPELKAAVRCWCCCVSELSSPRLLASRTWLEPVLMGDRMASGWVQVMEVLELGAWDFAAVLWLG